MFNSILLPYRDRPEHLKLFLTTLSACTHQQPYEVVIVDLGSETEALDIVEPFDELLDIHYHFIEYAGTFHKTKALNYALEHSNGLYVTPLDCDILLPPRFLIEIESAFGFNENNDDWYLDWEPPVKLSHRMLLLDADTTSMVKNRMGLFYSAVQGNPKRFEMASETYQEKIIGCSQFTIGYNELIEAGGWNEKFIGYGLEDVEMNMRLEQMGITTEMSKTPVFHLNHKREVRWDDPELVARNRKLFEELKEKQWPTPEPSDEWGKFEGQEATKAEV